MTKRFFQLLFISISITTAMLTSCNDHHYTYERPYRPQRTAKCLQPTFLKKGDKVALVSPAYATPSVNVDKTIEILKSWGLEPVVGPNVGKTDAGRYAGTVSERKSDMMWALNDNTIKAGKATVTVGGTAATVTEGKLQGVKMGSEVKVKANTGYKFRKVEVKKGEKLTLTVGDMVLDITGCTTWADVVAKNSDKIEALGPVVVQKDNHDMYIGPGVTTSSPVDTSVNYQWYEAK